MMRQGVRMGPKRSNYARDSEDDMSWKRRRWVAAGLVSVLACWAAARAEPIRHITIDGKFDDWADLRVYTDPPNNTHDTDHKVQGDMPAYVDHPDVDILEYKFAHDAEKDRKS